MFVPPFKILITKSIMNGLCNVIEFGRVGHQLGEVVVDVDVVDVVDDVDGDVDVVDVDVVDDGDVDEDDDKDHEWPVQSQRGWACRPPAERSIICPS